MLLSELEWIQYRPYTALGRSAWKEARFGQGSVIYHHTVSNFYNVYEKTHGHGRMWLNLEPIEAQCIVYHLSHGRK